MRLTGYVVKRGDFKGEGRAEAAGPGTSFSGPLRDNTRAKHDALVANISRSSGDQDLDLRVVLSAEGAANRVIGRLLIPQIVQVHDRILTACVFLGFVAHVGIIAEGTRRANDRGGIDRVPWRGVRAALPS